MNKILYFLVCFFVTILYADTNNVFYLREERLAELKCDAFKGNKEAAISVALHYDYVYDDALLASIWYFIADRNGSTIGGYRARGHESLFDFIKKFPIDKLNNEKVDNLTYCYIKYIHNLYNGVKDIKLRSFLASNGFKDNLLDIPKYYIDYMNSSYMLEPVEQKYLPILALKGNVKAAERAFAASILAGDTAPKYSLVLGYIHAVLFQEVSSFMRSEIVKKAFNISNANDIFMQLKPDIDNLAKNNDMYSDFILYQYFLRNDDHENAQKYYKILKGMSIDERFLSAYEFDGKKLVLLRQNLK